jgi:hypothetical protein
MTPDREPSLFELVRDPPLRTAAFVTAAAGLVAFGALFLFRGPAAAGVTAALAVLALVFRWTWPVGLYPFAVAYFLFLPDGTPINLTEPSGFTVRYGGFAVSDMLLVPAVLAYLVAQYRFLSLAKQAVPFDADSSFGPRAGAVRRPGELVTDRELKWLVGLVVAAMVFGQVAWYFLTRLQLEFLLAVPVRWLPAVGPVSDGVTVSPVLNRFLLLVFAGAVAAGVGRLVFWYWGLMQLSREEAVAVVTDAGWHEGRWELAAQEKRRGAAKAEADRRGLVTDPPEGTP